MLDVLGEVSMYVIQILGNMICNVIVDYFVGFVVDEIVDLCFVVELICQWLIDYFEFQVLLCKFKIVVFGVCENDCVVVKVYDIGVYFVNNDVGELGYQIIVGGGFGWMLMIGKVLKDWVS